MLNYLSVSYIVNTLFDSHFMLSVFLIYVIKELFPTVWILFRETFSYFESIFSSSTGSSTTSALWTGDRELEN